MLCLMKRRQCDAEMSGRVDDGRQQLGTRPGGGMAPRTALEPKRVVVIDVDAEEVNLESDNNNNRRDEEEEEDDEKDEERYIMIILLQGSAQTGELGDSEQPEWQGIDMEVDE
jgi:hypothetical protein